MAEKKPGLWRRLRRVAGPGVISGAADDDPAGIATYSIAGAQFGITLLWLAPLTWPLMAAVQGMCARVGMVTGDGLMRALKRKFPRPILLIAATALFGANTFNLGADLTGMADAAQMLTGLTSQVWVVGFGIVIAWATVALRYATIARVLKWLVLVLFTYVIAAFSLDPDWGAVAKATFVPEIPRGSGAWAMMLAILGTTISPYLFFWQASEEVEEEKNQGRKTTAERVGATRNEILQGRMDVGLGTFFGNLVFFFITLTTALTLHENGITRPETSMEVASALEPIAGKSATLLFAIGILGTGALAIPVLAGSAAYALSELFDWRGGMDERPTRAPRFYGVFVLSIVFAMAMEFADFSAVRALYLSAIINGMLAPVILIGILMVASDRKIMAGQPSPLITRAVVLITTLAMTVAAVAIFMV
jgi:NRAMP (natural resistance-associated macrophage protein)-like metal ion transporter